MAEAKKKDHIAEKVAAVQAVIDAGGPRTYLWYLRAAQNELIEKPELMQDAEGVRSSAEARAETEE